MSGPIRYGPSEESKTRFHAPSVTSTSSSIGKGWHAISRSVTSLHSATGMPSKGWLGDGTSALTLANPFEEVARINL